MTCYWKNIFTGEICNKFDIGSAREIFYYNNYRNIIITNVKRFRNHRIITYHLVQNPEKSFKIDTRNCRFLVIYSNDHMEYYNVDEFYKTFENLEEPVEV